MTKYLIKMMNGETIKTRLDNATLDLDAIGKMRWLTVREQGGARYLNISQICYIQEYSDSASDTKLLEYQTRGGQNDRDGQIPQNSTQ